MIINKFSYPRWLLVLFTVCGFVFLSACSGKPSDPFADYKKKSDSDILKQAEKHLAKHDYKQATTDLEALDGLYPFGEYTQQGQLDSIYAYYKNGDEAMALAAAQRYIRLYPRSENIDYAYYMQGLTRFEMGGGWLQNKLGLDRSARDITNYESAYASFATLDKLNPQSLYYQDSRTRMIFIRNLIARHEYEIARFYWQRNAYVASANRASYIIQHFQGAPLVIPAFSLLVKSDRKLNLVNQAQQNLAILNYNYPKQSS